MIARLARGRTSASVIVILAVPATRIAAAGLRKTQRRPVLLLVPGQIL